MADNYLDLNVTTDTYLSAADFNMDVGDILYEFTVACDDYTPAADRDLLRKWGAPGNFEILIKILSSGALQVQNSYDGTTVSTQAHTPSPALSDGSKHKLGFKVWDDAGTGKITYYIDDSEKETDTTTQAANGSVFNGSNVCYVFGSSVFAGPGGEFYKFDCTDVGTGLIADLDVTTTTQNTSQWEEWTDNSSNVWTVAGLYQTDWDYIQSGVTPGVDIDFSTGIATIIGGNI